MEPLSPIASSSPSVSCEEDNSERFKKIMDRFAELPGFSPELYNIPQLAGVMSLPESGNADTFRGDDEFYEFLHIYRDLPPSRGELDGTSLTEYLQQLIEPDHDACVRMLWGRRVWNNDLFFGPISDPLLSGLSLSIGFLESALWAAKADAMAYYTHIETTTKDTTIAEGPTPSVPPKDCIGSSSKSLIVWTILPGLFVPKASARFEAAHYWERYGTFEKLILVEENSAFLRTKYYIHTEFDISNKTLQIFFNSRFGREIPSDELLDLLSQKGDLLNISENPFFFLTLMISYIVDDWLLGFVHVQALAAKFEADMVENDLPDPRSTISTLHQLMAHHRFWKEDLQHTRRCLENLAEQQTRFKDLLQTPDHIVDRVDESLRILGQRVTSLLGVNERIHSRTDNLIKLIVNQAILANSLAMNNHLQAVRDMAESSREESQDIAEIAKDTKRDSEAMKILAAITVIYIPPSFVATLFSMGVSQFHFPDNDSFFATGWWIYFALTIPLVMVTLGPSWWYYHRKDLEAAAKENEVETKRSKRLAQKGKITKASTPVAEDIIE